MEKNVLLSTKKIGELKLKSYFSSVQFSRLVVSDSLQPHEPQHASPPCPSPTPRVHPNPCPLRWGCHPTISSSVIPFSSCPQSFSESGSFPMSQLFTSGGQSTGVSWRLSFTWPIMLSIFLQTAWKTIFDSILTKSEKIIPTLLKINNLMIRK